MGTACCAVPSCMEGRHMKRGEKRMIVIFMAPLVAVYLIFFLYPTLRTGLMSFFELSSLSSSMENWSFVGLKNYMELFQNSLFLKSYGNIIKILLIGGVGVFAISLYFAVVMQGRFRGKKVLRAIIYLPNIITPVALVAMWTQYIYNSQFGLLHSIFSAVGLDGLANIPWNSSQMAFWSMLIAFSFGSVGYYMVIYMAAIEQIPEDYFECARMEGANRFQIFRGITLPLLKPTTNTALTFWAAGSVNFFLWSRVFSSNPLDPETLVPASYMFTMAFGSNQMSTTAGLKVGPASAIGVLLTLTMLAVYALIHLLSGKEKHEY